MSATVCCPCSLFFFFMFMTDCKPSFKVHTTTHCIGVCRCCVSERNSASYFSLKINYQPIVDNIMVRYILCIPNQCIMVCQDTDFLVKAQSEDFLFGHSELCCFPQGTHRFIRLTLVSANIRPIDHYWLVGK